MKGPATMSSHPAPIPASAQPHVGVAAFAAVAERLETVLDHETEALQHNRPCDLAEITGRKRQGLLELSRCMPHLADGPDPEGTRHRLRGLAVKLERNKMVLDVQIRAVREVADIIARALRDAESDGTYSLAAGRS
jgi:hypothetical protein